MLLLLIVVPCVLAGIALVAVLDRTGVLPGPDRPGAPSSRAYHSTARSRPPLQPVPSIGRPLSLVAVVILATWILAWLVVLGVGLNIILSSS